MYKYSTMAEANVEDPKAMQNSPGNDDVTEPCDNSKDSCDTESAIREGDDIDDSKEISSEINPYAYLDRDQFTTEKFKIEINHPKRFGINQLKKRLVSLGLKPSKVKVIERARCSFVNFRSEEERDKALELLQGHVWMGKEMKVKKAKAAADPMLKKRKQEADDAERRGKVARMEDKQENLAPIGDRLNDTVTPWWKVPYPEQLKRKKEEMQAYLRKLGRVIEQNNPLIRPWMNSQKKQNKGFCCCLQDVIPSPIETGYRNKGEFTIGMSVNETDKTVGFRLGQYRSGDLCVVEPTECVHVSQPMKETVKMVQDYLQAHSNYPALDPETKAGHWITLTLRTNSQGQIMIIIQFHPQKLTKEELEKETSLLRGYFTGDGPGVTECQRLKVVSFYLHIQSDRHDGPEPVSEKILDIQPFEESLLGLRFRISPDAFFQVNTPAAECLYRQVSDLCGLSEKTVLLDVCCGTGTIGLTMAKAVQKVVGIEMCAEAVRDAKYNAEINNISNAEFHCGKAEDVLPWLIKRYARQDVVAVVDPPRAGLHVEVVKALRKALFVKRLVYVSCKPSAAITNITDFTREQSRRIKGSPFRLLKAIPVDLFPQTPYCELVMLLEREETVSGQTGDSSLPVEAEESGSSQTDITTNAAMAEESGQSAGKGTDQNSSENKDSAEEISSNGDKDGDI